MPVSSVPRTVFMFPGQGAQHFQMAKELFAVNAAFRDTLIEMDRVAQPLVQRSLVDAIYSAPMGEPFNRTLLTHPAIFMVEYALSQCLIDSGLVPDLTLGASLGSFAAATVAGCLDAREALTAVIRQAITFESCCKPGGMLAILANPSLFEEEFLQFSSDLAASHFPSHFVVSSTLERLAGIEGELTRREIAYQRLPVSFAFHSRWIDEARQSLEASTSAVRLVKARLPLICCDDPVTRTELSGDFFWNAVRTPIRFREAIAYLERHGAHRYIDVGPSATLATQLKYALPPSSRSTVHPILTPWGQDQKNMSALLKSAACSVPGI
jgi:bacillaene synthase trans-acting acyltransferase